MARQVARLLAWIAGCALVPLLLGSLGGAWIAIGLAWSAIATLWLIFWLPRSAHRAFEAAKYANALRRYRLIGALAFTRARQRAAELSRAACHLAAGRHEDAEGLLSRVDPAQLDAAERAVWLNNRACVGLDAGTSAPEALALADEAVALRPDVPGIQHTRARALIAVGRLDDAIGVLESMRAGGELPLRLEAERCRELAVAWERKGQGDYANDYRDRARLHAI